MTINQFTNLLTTLGQDIAQERLKQNLTQLALATHAGVAYSTLRKIESTGQGGMAHYAAILAALGQLEQLPFSSIATQSAQRSPRQRARAPKAAAQPMPPPDAARPSQKLGLDFPYDWSNPAISDTALIGKVLDRARFMDVSKTFAHYGHERVERAATDLGIDLTTGVLGSLMPGIQRGQQQAIAHV